MLNALNAWERSYDGTGQVDKGGVPKRKQQSEYRRIQSRPGDNSISLLNIVKFVNKI